MRLQQLAKVFNHKVRLYIALEVTCGSTMDMKSVQDNSKYVSRFISNAKMEADEVFWAFDAYIEANSGCLKGFAMVMKAIYDEDWADEAAILRYYNEEEHS